MTMEITEPIDVSVKCIKDSIVMQYSDFVTDDSSHSLTFDAICNQCGFKVNVVVKL